MIMIISTIIDYGIRSQAADRDVALRRGQAILHLSQLEVGRGGLRSGAQGLRGEQAGPSVGRKDHPLWRGRAQKG